MGRIRPRKGCETPDQMCERPCQPGIDATKGALAEGPWPGPEGARIKRAVRSWLPLETRASSREPDRDMELVGAMTLLKRAVRSWLALETGTCRA